MRSNPLTATSIRSERGCPLRRTSITIRPRPNCVSPYTLQVNGETIRGKMLFLGTGSEGDHPCRSKGLTRFPRFTASDSIISDETQDACRRAWRLSEEDTLRPSSGISSPRWGPRSRSSEGIRSSFQRRSPKSRSLQERAGKAHDDPHGHEVREVEATPSGTKKLHARETRTGRMSTLDARRS